MKLGNLLDQIDSLDEDHCIFATKPWTSESEADVCPLGAKGEPPPELLSKGYDYFLEVHIAKEVLETLSGRAATQQQKQDLLLFYAENDAYPNWVYSD